MYLKGAKLSVCKHACIHTHVQNYEHTRLNSHILCAHSVTKVAACLDGCMMDHEQSCWPDKAHHIGQLLEWLHFLVDGWAMVLANGMIN